jgi:tetratricopeptide (TPR) repeat protein
MKLRNAISILLLVCTSIVALPGIVAAKSIDEIQQIAKEITVRIDSQYPGSGFIIAKQGNVYYVLTAEHVVTSPDTYTIITPDGKEYPLNYSKVRKLAGTSQVDLAVVEFVSDRSYPVATLSTYKPILYERREYTETASHVFAKPSTNQNKVPIFVAGWPNPALDSRDLTAYRFNPGVLVDNSGSAIRNPREKSRGYELVYNNLTHRGMSGGPILDMSGRAIGVHGRAEGVTIDDRDEVVGQTLEESGRSFRVSLGNSMGVPISTFLTLLPQTGLGIPLNIEKSAPDTPPNQQIESWLPPIDINNQTPVYWVNRGNQLWRLGKLSESLDAFDRAIKIQPTFYQSWFAKGFILGFSKQYDRALEACNKAIELNPLFYDAWRCQGGSLFRLGRLSEALSGLDKAIEINKSPQTKIVDLSYWTENPGDYMERGEILFGLQRYDEAIASFNKAISINPDSPAAWNSRAFVQIHTKRLDDALSSLEKAIKIDPNFAPAWNNRGRVLSRLGRPAEAIASYEKAVKIDPNDVTGWNNLGTVLYATGRLQEALKSFEQALQIDSSYQPAIENREAVRQAIGKR